MDQNQHSDVTSNELVPESEFSRLIEAKLDDIARTISNLLRLFGDGNGLINPSDPLWERFRDMDREKRDIARYTCDTFLTDYMRSFIQASSTAIHLALGIPQCIARGNLIYSNSIVVPLAILPGSSWHKVYTFCGPIFDRRCGGWLFDPTDVETRTNLENLFTRKKDPLTTAFVMPTALKPKTGLYYSREETAGLVEVLASVAKQLVVLVPANRLYTDEQEFPPETAWIPAWRNQNVFSKKVTVVVSGTPPNLDIEDMVSAYYSPDLPIPWEIHWKNPVTDSWEIGPLTV